MTIRDLPDASRIIDDALATVTELKAHPSAYADWEARAAVACGARVSSWPTCSPSHCKTERPCPTPRTTSGS